MPNAVQYESAPAPTKDELGSLSNLATTNKTSAVAAINEVNNNFTNYQLKIQTVEITCSQDGFNVSPLPTGYTKDNSIILCVENYNTGNGYWYLAYDVIVFLDSANNASIYVATANNVKYRVAVAKIS